MFHRSQYKQQGFAKEQRVADAQLASLRQLGLIGPEIKGFASAWGGTDPIAAAQAQAQAATSNSQSSPAKESGNKFPNLYATRPFGSESKRDEAPAFRDKGESITVLSIPSPFYGILGSSALPPMVQRTYGPATSFVPAFGPFNRRRPWWALCGLKPLYFFFLPYSRLIFRNTILFPSF